VFLKPEDYKQRIRSLDQDQDPGNPKGQQKIALASSRATPTKLTMTENNRSTSSKLVLISVPRLVGEGAVYLKAGLS